MSRSECSFAEPGSCPRRYPRRAGICNRTARNGYAHARVRGTLLLPPQLPHQRQRRVAEQLLHRSRVELVDALEIAGVNAAGDEQAVDPESMGAGQIGPHRIADRQNPAQRRRRCCGARPQARWRARRSAGAACRRRSRRRRVRDRVRQWRRRNRPAGRRARPRCRGWRRSAAGYARAPAASCRDNLPRIRFRRRTVRCRRCSRPDPAARGSDRARGRSNCRAPVPSQYTFLPG